MLRPVQSADGYLLLSATGNSMSPTINNGDTTTVRLIHDGRSIRAGYLNSSEPGDIIVYSVAAAIAYIPHPETMWICHRAVQKYQKNGTWYFRTKGDNNPEIDSWEVPEYSLLGVVTQIDHEKMQQATTQSSSPVLTTLQTLPETIIGILAGFAIVAILEHRRRKSLRMLRKANVYSCFSCNYFSAQTTYELKKTNGKLGIQKKIDLSKGICAQKNITISSIPTKLACKAYKPSTPKLILSEGAENESKHLQGGSER